MRHLVREKACRSFQDPHCSQFRVVSVLPIFTDRGLPPAVADMVEPPIVITKTLQLLIFQVEGTITISKTWHSEIRKEMPSSIEFHSDAKEPTKPSYYWVLNLQHRTDFSP